MQWWLANWRMMALIGVYLIGAITGADLMYLHYQLEKEAQEALTLKQTQQAETKSLKIGEDLEDGLKANQKIIYLSTGNKLSSSSVQSISANIDASETARKRVNGM